MSPSASKCSPALSATMLSLLLVVLHAEDVFIQNTDIQFATKKNFTSAGFCKILNPRTIYVVERV